MNLFKKTIFLLFLTLLSFKVSATYLLIPMDNTQKNHIKAYGVAYWVLQNNVEIDWLLNYRGGSFMIKHIKKIEEELIIRGVSFEVIANVKSTTILSEISDPEVNMDVVKLEKQPKIAVYSPKNKQPWDDAVTLVLKYAEIPYNVVYDDEIIEGLLPKYDWLHLHHEDFTGQYGKFYFRYRNAPWYREQVRYNEETATRLGFNKVSQLKLAVAKKIKEFTFGGGFLFAMCSGTDALDIALSAEGLDICESMFDGDGSTPNYNSKLDYSKTFAFKDFTLKTSPTEYEFSNIDATQTHAKTPKSIDNFTLFDFSAKWDLVPTMLCQNHTSIVNGFYGQTTGYNKKFLKSNVLIMGENKSLNSAKYIHGEMGKGTWTFYGGHDPADYQHMVGDPPTDLNLHPKSAGYRLILNNILFPAAKKKKQKT
ncbi:MAG: asparagine synthetase B [Flavobacteriales bacterium]